MVCGHISLFCSGIVVFRSAHAMCESCLCRVFHEISEWPHGCSIMDFLWVIHRLEVVRKWQIRYRNRRFEHRRIHLHIDTLVPFHNLPRNIAIIFLGLPHQTVVIVVEGFGNVHIHLLEWFQFSCSLILSIDLVFIGMILLGSAIPARLYGQIRWLWYNCSTYKKRIKDNITVKIVLEDGDLKAKKFVNFLWKVVYSKGMTKK